MSVRSLLRLFVMVLVLGTTACTNAPERSFSVSKWSAEPPGRTTPLDVTLPAHLDTLLPRAPVEYVLRSSVEVPAALRCIASGTIAATLSAAP